ncbi:PLP-dependent aminotransferase family protein [Aquirhabdus sp.]|uniref:MocR-like pyridoxine biosynthesis transcription factor PdxR n=1 Tax=Aquirhabdus sp. TaxID=2824160 RepID=UPI00396CC5FC
MNSQINPIHLDPHDGTALYLQIYRRFREAISDGRLKSGERVPSIRGLASELGLARGTVETAYQLLISEGYLIAQGAAGTIVSPQLSSLNTTSVLTSPTALTSEQHISHPQKSLLPFQLGVPALDAFPRKTWGRIASRCARELGIQSLGYPDIQGHLPLRESITTYLGISRGISCVPEQVFVTSGYRGILHLITSALLQAGDQCWFEDPGYIHARRFLDLVGATLVPVPVDIDGLQIEEGIKRAKHARFAVVTPSHQSPTGVSLSLTRRLALLDWAIAEQSWIVEDDYDSEFRYDSRPLPALKSLDHEGRVLYAGSFSKVLFPGLRLAYLVVPLKEVERFRRSAQVMQAGSASVWTQMMVTEFMAQGHFTRHLKTMRALYRRRRADLMDALVLTFGDHIRIEQRAGGLLILIRFKDVVDDKAFALLAHQEGLAVHALSNWTMAAESNAGLLLAFTNISSREEALRLCGRLYEVWKNVQCYLGSREYE